MQPFTTEAQSSPCHAEWREVWMLPQIHANTHQTLLIPQCTQNSSRAESSVREMNTEKMSITRPVMCLAHGPDDLQTTPLSPSRLAIIHTQHMFHFHTAIHTQRVFHLHTAALLSHPPLGLGHLYPLRSEYHQQSLTQTWNFICSSVCTSQILARWCLHTVILSNPGIALSNSTHHVHYRLSYHLRAIKHTENMNAIFLYPLLLSVRVVSFQTLPCIQFDLFSFSFFSFYNTTSVIYLSNDMVERKPSSNCIVA